MALLNSDMMRNMLRGGNWSEGFRISDFSLFKGGYDEGMQMCIPFMCGVIQLFVIIMSFNIDD